MNFINKAGFLSFGMLLALALTAAGCGGGSGTSGSGVQSNAATSKVQVSLGDAPSNSVMAFRTNVTKITMTPTSGSPVTVLSSSTPMEMMNLTGTVQPLTMATVPQGTYSSATVYMSSVTVGYMNSSNPPQYVEKTMSGNYSGTVTFNPTMTVGSGSSELAFDMNMASSVQVDSSGNVTITPTFTATMNPMSTSTQSPWQGYMQGLVGSVSNITGSQFTMSMMMGQQSVIVNTDPNTTQFSGLTGSMSGMSQGMIVSVDGTIQPDGTLQAQSVNSLEDSGGVMGGGIVGNLNATPPTQMTMVANSGMGSGMSMSYIGGTMSIDIGNSTNYTMDTNVDLNNLPFTPVFDGSSIAMGQKIGVISSSPMGSGMTGGGMMGGSTTTMGTITADTIQLEQQGMYGTVSNYTTNGSQATFTLTPPSGSAFTTMTGATTITVYQQAGTQMLNTPTIGNGSQLEVRGLMFHDSGAYKMVASWIVTPTT